MGPVPGRFQACLARGQLWLHDPLRDYGRQRERIRRRSVIRAERFDPESLREVRVSYSFSRTD